MTIAEAEAWVERVRVEAADNDAERAHSAEDGLRQAVLEHIAALDTGEFGELARIALSTGEIDFERWYA